MWCAGGIVMMLFMLLFWGMRIAGLVVGIRWLVTQGRASGTDSAMQILRERYARGDIRREEFEAKRRGPRPRGVGRLQAAGPRGQGFGAGGNHRPRPPAAWPVSRV